MSLTEALTEIQQSTQSAQRRRWLRFKSQQRTIDDLIEETEQLVMIGASDIPQALHQRAKRMLQNVLGRIPSWVDRVVSPTGLLDHLFIAEGNLRRRYYVDLVIDLDDD